jgi:hypothetical protein
MTPAARPAPPEAARRKQRRIPLADQNRRRRELDEIRMRRALTPAERAEDDDLALRFAQRVWRAQLRDSLNRSHA